MADILIRGMEIDGRHHKALFTEKDGRPVVIVETALSYEERNVKVYPIAEIKTPYGRLIDADALQKSVLSQCEMVDAFGCPEMSQIAELIKNGLTQEVSKAETIIEAEGGSEDG